MSRKEGFYLPLDHMDLKEMKKRGDIDGLLDILDTGDVKECRAAICILGELRNGKAAHPLIGLLETDDIQIRANAAWALGEIGNAKAVLPMIALLNDPSDNVRIHAAWSLGRIGDRRALPGLHAVLKNGSADLRKHALEAIEKIESNGNGNRQIYENDEANFSETVDIPLVTLDIPFDLFRCEYSSRAENGETKHARFSKDLMITDTDDSNGTDKRKIVLGLKNEFKGSVSVDIILKYSENNGHGKQTNSVWLQMENLRKKDAAREEEKEEQRGDFKRRTHGDAQPLRRSGGYDLTEDKIMAGPSSDYDFDYPEEKTPKKKEIVRPEKRGHGKSESPILEPEAVSVKDSVKPGKKSPEAKVAGPEPEKVNETIKPEKKLPEIKTGVIKPEVEVADTVKSMKEELQSSPVKSEPEGLPAKGQNIDSAVRLLSDIGMSGMTSAASTVTQLSGEEAESGHSQLRTLPITEMHDEITSLGDSVAKIGIELHGNGPAGEVKGEIQLYISRESALDIANELLCNPPDVACKEFTDDIISTLKETANIFCGQYISAVSEYIEVPLLLNAPTFKTGASLKIAESAVNEIEGKVEFALATNLALGMNKTGRLIMLVDPKSFDIIIQKLFNN